MEEIKTEMSKEAPNITHIKKLLTATHVNRRKWIDGTKSTELRLAIVIEEYPCFYQHEALLHELALLKGIGVITSFPGLLLLQNNCL